MNTKEKILLQDAETNRIYSVYATVEEMKRLETDFVFAMEKLLEAQKNFSQESLIEDNGNNADIDENMSTNSSYNADIDEDMSTTSSSNADIDKDVSTNVRNTADKREHMCSRISIIDEESGNIFKWPHEAILLLIEEYTYKQNDFSSGKHSQKKIWSLISSEMVKHGHDVTGSQCQSKFSGLKWTYKTIKNAKNKSGSGTRCTWPYFEHMDNLLNSKPFMTPVKTLSSTGVSTNSFRGTQLFTESKSEDEKPVQKKARQMSTLEKALENLSEERRKSEEATEKRHRKNIEFIQQLLNSFNEMIKIIGKK